MYECIDCGNEQDPKTFDGDLVNAYNAAAEPGDDISSIKQLDTISGVWMREAADGDPGQLCAKCFYAARERALELIAEDERAGGGRP